MQFSVQKYGKVCRVENAGAVLLFCLLILFIHTLFRGNTLAIFEPK